MTEMLLVSSDTSLSGERVMADCVDCGKKIGFLNRSSDGERCVECLFLRRAEQEAENADYKESLASVEREREQAIQSQIDAILLTTETSSNLPIVRRIEVITAECAFGMNIFKDLFAGVRDIVGGRSEAIQKTMRDARRTTLNELKREAYELGANAVVGVDLDYVELSSSGNMVMLVASGTAVEISVS
jgi:uncharacterized protein YbjQ (UPF0145 family)